ncbi:MAG: hypothetical protein WBD40_16480 [Tepidisphaeraceae bacterium]
MSDESTTQVAPAQDVQSPPPAPMPARADVDEPRAHLHRLAAELIRTHNRRLVVEYLRLRRALR